MKAYQKSDRVKVIDLTDNSADRSLLGRDGLIYDICENGSQLSAMHKPLYSVDFGDRKADFWGEELSTHYSLGEAIHHYVDELNAHSILHDKPIKEYVCYYRQADKWHIISVLFNGQQTAFCFVSKSGCIYKPASDLAPAKGSKGNVYNEIRPMNGRELMV